MFLMAYTKVLILRSPRAGVSKDAQRRSSQSSVLQRSRNAGKGLSEAQPPARDLRAFGHRLHLGPDDVLGDATHAGRGVEAAIGAGHDSPGVADDARNILQPLGNDLGVLDKAGE